MECFAARQNCNPDSDRKITVQFQNCGLFNPALFR